MKIARTLICGLLVGTMLASAQDHGAKSLAARVQRLEDEEEIRMLLVDYGRSLDARDFARYAGLFAKDGEWTGGFGTAKGPAAIKAMMDKDIGSTPAPRPNSTYHLLTNFAIDVHGDTATVWSRWSFVATGKDNKPVILQSGHYDDIVAREDGRWKFKKRVASNDIPYFADPGVGK
ncbi:MAG TPA: nuclear transport factor 2 family protein [Bryobacteraceae bacterium]|nr:nuclear transport factor 2 family protein [Bryobacteraceae bacterium]